MGGDEKKSRVGNSLLRGGRKRSKIQKGKYRNTENNRSWNHEEGNWFCCLRMGRERWSGKNIIIALKGEMGKKCRE